MANKFHLGCLLIILVSCNRPNKRNIINEFYSDRVSIENIPPDLLSVIINDLKEANIAQTISLSQTKLSESSVDFNNPSSLDTYSQLYKQALYKSSTSNPDALFFTTVSDNLARKGVQVYSNYQKSKLSEDINFLLPLINRKATKQSIDSITRDVILEKIPKEFEIFVTDRIDYFYQKGVNLLDLKKEAFLKRFASKFERLEKINSDSIFGILAPSMAFELAKKIKKNQLRIAETEVQLKAKARALNAKGNQLSQKTGALVRHQIVNIDLSLRNLKDNEEIALQLVGNIYKKAKELTDSANAIGQILKSGQISNASEAQMQKLQIKYYKYTKGAYVLTDVISDYQKGRLDSSKLLRSINNKYFQGVLIIDNTYKEIKKSIEELAEVNLKTLSTVSFNVVNNLQVAAADLERMKLLKGKDAQNVGTFLKYLTSSIQVITGAAKVYGGDATGIFNIMRGVSAFAGGSPDPSPEAQMLLFMDSRFNHIDTTLKIINTKIDSLTSITISLYKQVVENFKLVFDALEKLNDEILSVKELIKQVALNDYRSCRLPSNISTGSTASFKDYTTNYQHTKQCLKGLSDFTNPGSESLFFAQLNSGSEPGSLTQTFLQQINKPLVEYIKSKLLTSRAREVLVNSALFPSFEFGKMKPAEIVSEYMEMHPHERIESAIDTVLNPGTYINYNFLYEFSLAFIKMANYFLIKSNTDLEPMSLAGYMQTTENDRRNILEDYKSRLYFLYKLTKLALAQQSLLSGNDVVYMIYSTLTNSDNILNKQNALTCLGFNSVLSHNYAKLLLQSKIFFANRDSGIFNNYTSMFYYQMEKKGSNLKEAMKQVNDALRNQGTDKYLSVEYSESNKSIQLNLKSPGVSNEIKVIAPDPEDLLDNKFIQNGGVYKMLELQEKLRLMLINSTFNSFLVSTSNKSQKIFKALYTGNSMTK